MANRIEQSLRDLTRKRERARKDVPRVPALDTAQIDPERAQRESDHDHSPRVQNAEYALPDHVHQEERHQAEEKTRPSRGGQENDVVQNRHAAVATDVLE